jgi:hypothetical protein
MRIIADIFECGARRIQQHQHLGPPCRRPVPDGMRWAGLHTTMTAWITYGPAGRGYSFDDFAPRLSFSECIGRPRNCQAPEPTACSGPSSSSSSAPETKTWPCAPADLGLLAHRQDPINGNAHGRGALLLFGGANFAAPSTKGVPCHRLLGPHCPQHR